MAKKIGTSPPWADPANETDPLFREVERREEAARESFLEKWLNNRWLRALLYLVLGVLMAFVVGGLFWLATGTKNSYLDQAMSCYVMFGACTVPVALVHVLDPNVEEIEAYLGIGFYYGGAILMRWFEKIDFHPSWSGFLISAAICIAAYRRYKKEHVQKEDCK